MPLTPSRFAALSLALLLLALPAEATKKPRPEKQTDPLDQYLTHLSAAPPAPLTLTSGSVFTPAVFDKVVQIAQPPIQL